MGDKLYHIKSEKSQHIIEMVKRQKMGKKNNVGAGAWKRKREGSETKYADKRAKKR